MSEYKAQILTILLVITVFTALKTVYPEFFETLWTKIEATVTSQI